MAKNKNRKQGGDQDRGQQQAPERSAEPQQTEVQNEAPSPSNMAERSKRQKKFGHN
ncbi:hypothetical protein ACFQVC_33800 [Streptomyces monticola]|uniref:Small hydrophilic protein n=1 Tax=Streptomyces monticola TaxID=2666263 RepID=A0ABW2JTB8_9ACTN